MSLFFKQYYSLQVLMFERGSPSLVGRGIANPMFERTRGFESHSPRPTRGVILKDLLKYISIKIRKSVIKIIRNRIKCCKVYIGILLKIFAITI